MKNLCYAVIALVCLLTAGTLAAQSNNSFFLGGSYTHNGELPTSVKGALGTLQSGSNIGGVDAGLFAKFAGPLGLALDVNYSGSASQNQVIYAAGPEISLGKNTQFFAHALIGGAYQNVQFKNLKELSDSSFAYELGGGFRHFFSKHFGVRSGLDYIYTEAFHLSDHNLRATVGVLFR